MEKKPCQKYDHDPFLQEGGVEAVEINLARVNRSPTASSSLLSNINCAPGREESNVSTSRNISRDLNDTTVGTDTEKTGRVLRPAVVPSPEEHQSGAPVVTGMKLEVMF